MANSIDSHSNVDIISRNYDRIMRYVSVLPDIQPQDQPNVTGSINFLQLQLNKT